MSENLDLVRSIFAAWERGDFGAVDWADPAIEFITADGPAPGRRGGVAGMEEASRDWVNTWEGYRVQAHQHRELDNERVLLVFGYRARGKASGLELEQLEAKGAGVSHIDAGNVARLVAWWDRDRALADLGLEG
jgi:ketosteroid isomerase-like protein